MADRRGRHLAADLSPQERGPHSVPRAPTLQTRDLPVGFLVAELSALWHSAPVPPPRSREPMSGSHLKCWPWGTSLGSSGEPTPSDAVPE